MHKALFNRKHNSNRVPKCSVSAGDELIDFLSQIIGDSSQNNKIYTETVKSLWPRGEILNSAEIFT